MISVRDNVAAVLAFTDRFSSQYRFAVAKGLTDTVRAVAARMPEEVDKAFEGGAVPFTRQAFYAQGARKDRLVASVGIKKLQAEYLRYQVQGGQRQPKRRALRLPAVVQLTPQGNLPTGTIARLVARAKAGKSATKGQARRFGVSAGAGLFYGEPGGDRPAGIYQRVDQGNGRTALVPVVMFVQTPARYRPRFDFHGLAQRQVAATLSAALRRAWAHAKATAK